jgi:hypothetical protein
MKKLSIFLIALSVSVVSCGPRAAKQAKGTLQEEEKVVLLDGVLARNLQVVKEKTDRTDSGQLRVRLEIENIKNADLWTDVQVIFRDSEGFELEKTSWEPTQFHRRAVTTIVRNAMDTKASEYRVLIRNTR